MAASYCMPYHAQVLGSDDDVRVRHRNMDWVQLHIPRDASGQQLPEAAILFSTSRQPFKRFGLKRVLQVHLNAHI